MTPVAPTKGISDSRAARDRDPRGFLRRNALLLVAFALLGAILALVIAPRIADPSGTPDRLKGPVISPQNYSETRHASPGHRESDSISIIFNTPEDKGPQGNPEHDPNATGY